MLLQVNQHSALFFFSDRLCVQVYPDGIRHIRADKRVNEWKTPGKKTIVRCAVNQRQVVIALTGGELVYFEMDPVRKMFLCVFVFWHILHLLLK